MTLLPEEDDLLPRLPPTFDAFWEDDDLIILFAKEDAQSRREPPGNPPWPPSARKEATDWILKSNSRYGFSSLTAMLAVNYLDRFLLTNTKEAPWLIHLLAVACLSLAAKVEETAVPLLPDLQAEDAKYVFEAKAVRRMELLVLSALQWRMHPVTPFSFLDHLVRRLGMTSAAHWEFRRQCELVIVSFAADSRSARYLPSEVATSAVAHVVDQLESFAYRKQLLAVLKRNNERVSECCSIIKTMRWEGNDGVWKRKLEGCDYRQPESPSCVIDVDAISSDASNDSWMDNGGLRSPSIVTASPSNLTERENPEPLYKKTRVEKSV